MVKQPFLGLVALGPIPRPWRRGSVIPGQGNVRELENAVERAVVVGKGRQIKLCDLPFIAAGGTAETGELSLEELEPQDIAQLLAAKGSTISPVARGLLINCSTLYEKIKKYGLAT